MTNSNPDTAGRDHATSDLSQRLRDLSLPEWEIIKRVMTWGEITNTSTGKYRDPLSDYGDKLLRDGILVQSPYTSGVGFSDHVAFLLCEAAMAHFGVCNRGWVPPQPVLPRYYAQKTDAGWSVVDGSATVELIVGLERVEAETIAAVRNGDKNRAKDLLSAR